MGATKSDVFTHTQSEIARLTKALGHPARIAILQELIKRESCVCGDLVAALPLAQATVSQHLKVLKEAGLIKGDIEPKRSCYCIDTNGWKQAQAILSTFFDSFSPLDDCC